jgi:probable rRNA maturation factor
MIEVTVHSHWEGDGDIPLGWLDQVAATAMPAILEVSKGAGPPLRSLREVEASIISDSEIARIHAEFLDDPTPTDVITFHHGEIVISADTAARQAAEHGQTRDRELALYLIHGLLHLAGWDDHEPGEAAEMAHHQENILSAVMVRIGTAH